MPRGKVIIKEPVAAPTRLSRRPVQKNATAEPFVVTVKIFDEVQPDGNDVVFSFSGTCPADIDADDFEQYIADYFGECDE